MEVKVTLSPSDVSREMEGNPNFGAAVLESFLGHLGRHPREFAQSADFRCCRIMFANQLRDLADEIEKS